MVVTDEFKAMVETDIVNLKDALSDLSNTKTMEYAKLELYKDITAKYHICIPKFGDGLYAYIEDFGFYDEVTGDSLFHNLRVVLNKLLATKAAGYQILISSPESKNGSVVLNANYSSHNENSNINEMHNVINISFNEVRQQIEDMGSLSSNEISEILDKINELERIIKSSDRRSKKWKKINSIIKWIADKGVDVGIALLPLLLQIK